VRLPFAPLLAERQTLTPCFFPNRHIAGHQTWRTNTLAELGEQGVRLAEERGDDMAEVSVVVERLFTKAGLQWAVAENRRLLETGQKASSRL